MRGRLIIIALAIVAVGIAFANSRGDKSKDAALLPGDVIYFPPIGALAAISGAVKNPAIYELKGPTAMATLLDYAGGLTTTAQTRRVSIERIQERESRVVHQITLDMGGLARIADALFPPR